MQKVWPVLLAACAAVGGSDRPVASGLAAGSERAPRVDFRCEIWPVIEQKCLRCHNGKKKEGALDMSTRAAMLKGGHSGPAFVPGDAEKSLMLELIEFDEMPPRKEKPRVTKAEFGKLRAWVAAGAPVPAEERLPGLEP